MDVRTIFDFNREPVEVLHEILLKRGFLVELRDGQLRLSDNAMLLPVKRGNRHYHGPVESDAEFLAPLLEKRFMARMDSDYVIHCLVTDYARAAEFLFRFKQTGGEAGYEHRIESWRYFSREHAFKVPVAVLEPFVALLVKGFSAAGVMTYSCCDGHGIYPAHVAFVEGYNLVWAETVIDVVHKNLHHGLFTEIKKDTLFMDAFSPVRNMHEPAVSGIPDSFYKGMLNAGAFIYRNRFILRDIKRELVETADIGQRNDSEQFREHIARGKAKGIFSREWII